MTLVNYKETNLAKGQLLAGINASQTTINLKSGEGDLFPSVFPFILKLEQYDLTSTLENKPVLKREIVKCTNRVGDVLTVVRGFEACPASDTATTQTTTQFAFDADDYIYHTETAGTQKDLKDELVRIETDKLDVADYISGDKLFADSTTGTDDYEATIAGITSYAQIDGQALRIRVDVGNTADATLNINSLGAKDIVKFKDEPLQTGDVEAGQIIFVIYNGDTDDFEIKDSIDQAGRAVVDKFQKDVVLGEDVTAGDGKGLVFMGEGIEDTFKNNSYNGNEFITFGELATASRYGIKFPSAPAKGNIIRSLVLEGLKKVGTPADIIISLLDSSENPVAGFVPITLLAADITTSESKTIIDLGDFEIDPSTDYIIDLDPQAVDAANYYAIRANFYEASTNGTVYNHPQRNSGLYTFASYDEIANNFVDLDNGSKIELTTGYNFLLNKAWNASTVFESTIKADAVIIESGLANDTKKSNTEGLLLQTSVSSGKMYYIKDYMPYTTLNNIGANSVWSVSSGSGSGVSLTRTQGLTLDQDLLLYGITLRMGFKHTQGSSGKTVKYRVRIETDDGSGNASGTLINANATGEITFGVNYNNSASGIRAVKFSSSFTIPAGTRFHIVAYASNNGGNYARVYIGKTSDLFLGESTAEDSTASLAFILDGYFNNIVGGEFEELQSDSLKQLVVGGGFDTTHLALMINEQNFTKTGATFNVVGGTAYTMIEALTNRQTNSTAFHKFKEFEIGKIYGAGGEIVGPYNMNIYYEGSISDSSLLIYFETHINGVLADSRNKTGSTYDPHTFTTNLNIGDVVSIFMRVQSASENGRIQNAKIQFGTELIADYNGKALLD